MIVYNIERDFIGEKQGKPFAVSCTDYAKNIERVKLGFETRQACEEWIKIEDAKQYKGSGVRGNEITL